MQAQPPLARLALTECPVQGIESLSYSSPVGLKLPCFQQVPTSQPGLESGERQDLDFWESPGPENCWPLAPGHCLICSLRLTACWAQPPFLRITNLLTSVHCSAGNPSSQQPQLGPHCYLTPPSTNACPLHGFFFSLRPSSSNVYISNDFTQR